MSKLPLKKLYVDTRYKISGTNSNFKIELPENITCDDNTVIYIDDITLPNSFWCIEENVNNKLYLFITPATSGGDPNDTVFRIVSITPGNYTPVDLSTEIQQQIRSSIVGTVYNSNIFSTMYNSKTNTIQISISLGLVYFKILTPLDLKSKLNNTWLGSSYDINKPDDINDVLSNLDGYSKNYDNNNPFISGYINTNSINEIYMCSSALGNFNNFGLGNIGTNVIKQIPMNSQKNEYVFDQVILFNDYADVSHRNLRTLDFQFKDVRGNIVNFHGVNLSFSIISSRTNPEL